LLHVPVHAGPPLVLELVVLPVVALDVDELVPVELAAVALAAPAPVEVVALAAGPAPPWPADDFVPLPPHALAGATARPSAVTSRA
jgi:hypothetical protein